MKNSDPAAVRIRTSIGAALYLVIAGACTRVPLFNSPGFEFAFIIGAAGSLIAGLLTIGLVKPAYAGWGAATPRGPFPLRASVRRAMVTNFALLGLPLAVIFLNGLAVPLCDPLDGLAFFFLIPVVSVWFAVALAVFCTVHYRLSKTIFLFLVAATLLYAAALGYWTPAIFSYNFFYGYFPGLSYDEMLPLTGTLVFFRTLTLLCGGLLLWLSGLLVRHTNPEDGAVRKGVRLLEVLVQPRHLPVTAIAVTAAAMVFVFRCPLGFESSARYVQHTLGGRAETDHFVIYYDPSSEQDLPRLGALHEFHLLQVLEAFHLPRTEKITSYVYPSVEIKRRLVGTGTTEIAKPWTREVHLTRQSLDGTLRHELVHVVAGAFGVPVIRASLSTGLVEGLAMAVEGVWGFRTLHQYSAAMRAAHIAPDIERIMSFTGFASQASSVSYVLAGSFCAFLIERHGIRPLLQVYRTGEYEGAYQQSLPSLIAAWGRALDSMTVDNTELAAVDVFFRRPSIFGKFCPRRVARRLHSARLLAGERRYDEAGAQFAAILSTAGGYEALSGVLMCRLRTGDYGGVIALYDSVVRGDEHPLRYLPLALGAGDACWARRDTARARALFLLVRRCEVSPNLTEAAAVRLWALDMPQGGGEWLSYYLTDAPDSARAVLLAAGSPGLDSILARYLLGRVSLRLRRYADARDLMLRTGAVPRDAALEATRQITIADALDGMGSYQEASGWYWSSLNADARAAAVAAMTDRVAWCEWRSHHPQP